MRRVTALLAALALLVTLAPAATLAVPPGGGARQSVIVVFNDSVGNPGAAAADLGRRHAFGLQFVYRHALKGFAASVPAGALNALARDPRVAWVEPDQAVQIDVQTTPTGVQRIFADDNANITINGTDDKRVDADIAILDTGIDLDHPDLNVFRSTSCLHRSRGGPFASYSCGSGGDDDNAHGTHVAGSAAALDNDIGVVGVAPGARLWAVKVLDANGSGSLAGVTAGIDYVTANADAIDVANMSLGCECSSDALDAAIAKSVAAGVTYAVAAGNSDANASTHSPANHDDVITVSALADFNGAPGGGAAPTCRSDQDDTLADFSNWGSTIEIAAPGTCILSTVPGGGYDTFSGTSMASPHAAGAAALLASNGGTPATIEATLVAEGNVNWTDDSGDGIKEPLLDVSDSTVFNPATVAGEGGGETVPPPDENQKPTANDVDTSGDENTTITWQPSVTDPNSGDTLRCTIGPGGPSLGGTATVASNCSSGTYTPPADTFGTATFGYTVTDEAGLFDTGTVTIVVNEVADPPSSGSFALTLTGSSSPGGNRWTAVVTILATGADGPLSGVTASGTWSDGTSSSCETKDDGTCTVSLTQHKRVSSATFTVSTASHTGGLQYDGGLDSETVLKP